jgi:hypothetical protein
MAMAAARMGDALPGPARSTLGDVLRLSFGRSETARNLIARPRAVTAIAKP